jgi:hypothetical protein
VMPRRLRRVTGNLADSAFIRSPAPFQQTIVFPATYARPAFDRRDIVENASRRIMPIVQRNFDRRIGAMLRG